MTLSARRERALESLPSSPLSASAKPLATPALPAGRTALTAGFFSFQIELNLFAIVPSVAHQPFSISNPCRSRHAQRRFRTCSVGEPQQLDEFFILITKCGDKRRFGSLSFDTSGSHRRQDSRYLSDPSRRIHDPDSGPALLSAASLPYASMQSAAPVPAPPPGEVFLCPFFPVRPAVPPVSTIPFQRSRSNDPVPTIPFQRSRRTTWPIAGSAAGGD